MIMNKNINKLSLLILILGIFGFSASALANYQVSPMNLHISEKQKVTSLTVKNLSDKETSFQVSVLKLEHKNGHDAWVETKELVVVTPVVFRTAPGKSQLVRIAMRGPIAGEHKYSLSIKELPLHGPKIGENESAVSFITEFRVPVDISLGK